MELFFKIYIELKGLLVPSELQSSLSCVSTGMLLFTDGYMLVQFSKMCWLKTSESEMKVIRVVKSQGVILYTDLLKILVFSSMVGYLDGGIYCEEGMYPFFFSKMLNFFNCFNTRCLAGLFLPQHCTVLILMCRKTCCTITAY